jgi:phage gp36-like protein
MPYCTHDEIEKLVGPEQFRQALDDDRDGAEDTGLFAALAVAASSAVDAYLGARYPVPFSNPPAFARLAARAFCSESLYKRRGVSRDANPFTSEADALRKRLEIIMSGDSDLELARDADRDDVLTETEPSRLAQTGGRMLF